MNSFNRLVLLKDGHDICAKVRHVLGNKVAEMTQVILFVENYMIDHLAKSPTGVFNCGKVVFCARN